MRQVPVGAIEVVSQIGTAFAAFFPIRAEHKVVNDELAAAAEKIGQRLFASRGVEDVLFVDLYHRQLTPRGAERVSLTCEFFFSRQQIFSGDQPLSFRNDFSLFRSCSWFHLLQFHFGLLCVGLSVCSCKTCSWPGRLVHQSTSRWLR